jgi:hypothetical protein
VLDSVIVPIVILEERFNIYLYRQGDRLLGDEE